MNNHLETLETLMDSDYLKVTKLILRSGGFWKTANFSHESVLMFEGEIHIILDLEANDFETTPAFESLLNSLSSNTK